MSKYVILLLLVIEIVAQQQGHRVAPGVPPQHYQPNNNFNQQPPPPQHHQLNQQQFQQPPPPQQFQGQQGQQHFQQPPPIQQQVQQQFQPNHGASSHGAQIHHEHHPGGGQLLDASNLNNERQHIQEHMEVPMDTSNMSEQELQFHYFKMHDADNNNKLDGCELVKSLIHWHDQSNHDPRSGQPIPEAKVFGDDELVNMIDPILQNDDKNGDGFIDYAEFSLAQASAAARAKTSTPPA